MPTALSAVADGLIGGGIPRAEQDRRAVEEFSGDAVHMGEIHRHGPFCTVYRQSALAISRARTGRPSA